MAMLDSDDRVREYSNASDHVSSAICRCYSLVNAVDDAWSQLASLKVFASADSTILLDLIDITFQSPRQRERIVRTFKSSNEFEHYLTHSPMERGVRFM
jgi:hypothetical protein